MTKATTEPIVNFYWPWIARRPSYGIPFRSRCRRSIRWWSEDDEDAPGCPWTESNRAEREATGGNQTLRAILQIVMKIAFCNNCILWEFQFVRGEILNFIGNLEVLFAPALWNYSQVQVASKPNHKTCKHHVNLPPQKRNHLKGDLPKKSKDVGVMFEEPCLPPPQPKCFPNCLRIAMGERWRWAAVK